MPNRRRILIQLRFTHDSVVLAEQLDVAIIDDIFAIMQFRSVLLPHPLPHITTSVSLVRNVESDVIRAHGTSRPMRSLNVLTR
jgi:hypothetical protein